MYHDQIKCGSEERHFTFTRLSFKPSNDGQRPLENRVHVKGFACVDMGAIKGYKKRCYSQSKNVTTINDLYFMNKAKSRKKVDGQDGGR